MIYKYVHRLNVPNLTRPDKLNQKESGDVSSISHLPANGRTWAIMEGIPLLQLPPAEKMGGENVVMINDHWAMLAMESL
jgi:hypothetical protein